MLETAKGIKAIFFDIDGTLVSFDTHRIPASAMAALHALREKGIKLCVATGRHKGNLDVLENTFDFDAYVTLNGQYAHHGDKVLHKNPFPAEDILPVIRHVEQGLYPCYFLGEHDFFLSGVNNAVRQLFSDINTELPPICKPAWAREHEIFQINAFLTKEQEAAYFTGEEKFSLVRWHPNFADVIPVNGGKEFGIKAVMAALGLAGEKVMVFGDGENDMSMLQYADLGVAMGNASDLVKASADYVTSHINDNGISNALRELGIL